MIDFYHAPYKTASNLSLYRVCFFRSSGGSWYSYRKNRYKR